MASEEESGASLGFYNKTDGDCTYTVVNASQGSVTITLPAASERLRFTGSYIAAHGGTWESTMRSRTAVLMEYAIQQVSQIEQALRDAASIGLRSVDYEVKYEIQSSICTQYVGSTVVAKSLRCTDEEQSQVMAWIVDQLRELDYNVGPFNRYNVMVSK